MKEEKESYPCGQGVVRLYVCKKCSFQWSKAMGAGKSHFCPKCGEKL